MTAAPLPRLIDCAGIARELGVSRAVAEKLMRQLPKKRIPDVNKVYVLRADVDKLLDENTEFVVSAAARKRLQSAA